MKVVKDTNSWGQVLAGGADVGWRCVDGHSYDLACGALYAPSKRDQSPSAPALTLEGNHACGQLQDNGPVVMSHAYTDLIKGELLKLPEHREGESLLVVTFLDVFDHVPARTQMAGCTLSSHVLGQIQGITLERLDVGPAVISEARLEPPYQPTGHAKYSLYGQGQAFKLCANGQSQESSTDLTPGRHLDRLTSRKGEPRRLLANAKTTAPPNTGC